MNWSSRRRAMRALKELRCALIATDEYGRDWARARPILIAALMAAIFGLLLYFGVI